MVAVEVIGVGEEVGGIGVATAELARVARKDDLLAVLPLSMVFVVRW